MDNDYLAKVLAIAWVLSKFFLIIKTESDFRKLLPRYACHALFFFNMSCSYQDNFILFFFCSLTTFKQFMDFFRFVLLLEKLRCVRPGQRWTSGNSLSASIGLFGVLKTRVLWRHFLNTGWNHQTGLFWRPCHSMVMEQRAKKGRITSDSVDINISKAIK